MSQPPLPPCPATLQGVGSLYKGLSAGLLRQATYTTARLGIYNNIFEKAKQWNDNKVGSPGLGAAGWTAGPLLGSVCRHAAACKARTPEQGLARALAHAPPPLPPSLPSQPLPLWQKAVCGLTAGGLGALVGSPADLSLIRMQADTTLPPEQRRNYKGAFDALTRIVKVRPAGAWGGAAAIVSPCACAAGPSLSDPLCDGRPPCCA